MNKPQLYIKKGDRYQPIASPEDQASRLGIGRDALRVKMWRAKKRSSWNNKRSKYIEVSGGLYKII